MKKPSVIVLALILAVSGLTACSSNNGSGKQADNQASESNSGDSQQAQTPGPGISSFQPFVFSGTGDAVTELTVIPARYVVASIKVSNNGDNNYFGVEQVNGDLEDVTLLVNTVGDYQGSVLVDTERYGTDGKVAFSVDANRNGNWEIIVTPLVASESNSFAGAGDYVSGVFLSPGISTWKFSHDGTSNFKVFCYSLSGDNDRVVNEIGAYEAESSVTLGEGYVFWVVQADGNWSITFK